MPSPTVKLTRLDITAFRSLVEPQSITLPDHGLVAVVGQNGDTDSSSGAGKTSLVDAIAFGQGYSEFKATDLQSWDWLTDKSLSVGQVLETPKGTVELKRGRKQSLRIGAGEPITSAAAVADELRKVVGLRPEMLKALTYRPQKKPGLFLSMTDGEKKSFLTELLGLGVFEQAIEAATKSITSLERAVEVQTALVEQAKASLGAQPAAPVYQDVALLEAELDQTRKMRQGASLCEQANFALVAKLSAAVDARVEGVNNDYLPRLQAIKSHAEELKGAPVGIEGVPEIPKLRERLKFLQDSIAKFKRDHTGLVTQKRAAVREAQNRINSLRERAALVPGLAADEKRLRAEVEKLEQQTCPTCERPWSDDKHSALIEAKWAAHKGVAARLAGAEAAAAQVVEGKGVLKPLEYELALVEGEDPVPQKFKDGEQEYLQKVAAAEERQRNLLKTAQAERDAALAKLRADFEALRNEHNDALNAARTDEKLATARNEHEKAERLVRDLRAGERNLESSLATARSTNRALLAQFESAQEAFEQRLETMKDSQDTLDAQQKALDEERDYIGLLKGFLAVIFDETLNRIATLANERIARIPNVQALTLRFVSERETKTTGTLRQEIRPVVEKDGHEIPLKAGLSGGMYAAVELAVDLSVADVVAERTGVYPGWLILDEAFDGLGIKEKAACLELLREAAETRLILVIDHASETKEAFDLVITVRSEDGCSTVVSG